MALIDFKLDVVWLTYGHRLVIFCVMVDKCSSTPLSMVL